MAKGPTTAQGMVNKMLTGDGRKSFSKQVANEILGAKPKSAKKTTKKACKKK
ncbi:hypothetical protein [Methanococcus maripaludis]|uniref:Uncharacterized protein n=1 Tax=Methanococcus maripaludis TaxID=39152 RepID=A0A7J9PF57_METMI|nr:hypothetical protein [Methanococcus maripaludis]MBA2861885.1 hypothetical protein [Methanococcus maripaludis]